MKRALYIFATLLICTLSGGATSVVLIRRPDHIVVAADTLTNYHNTNVPFTYICKIERENSVFFAIVGLRTFTGRGRKERFDAERIARSAIRKSNSIASASSHVVRATLKPFAVAMERIRKYDPTYFEEMFGDKPEPLTIVFWRMEKGQASYVRIAFSLEAKPNSRIRVTPHLFFCPGNACPDGLSANVVVVGASAASRELIQRPNFFLNKSDVRIAREMVAAEEQHSPQEVGGPIDVLTLDANGDAYWSVGGLCSGQ